MRQLPSPRVVKMMTELKEQVSLPEFPPLSVHPSNPYDRRRVKLRPPPPSSFGVVMILSVEEFSSHGPGFLPPVPFPIQHKAEPFSLGSPTAVANRTGFEGFAG